jgi:glycosyltransferase involved in cell wall biosynthesis
MNLGQATLSFVGSYIPAKSQLRTQWDHLQQSVSWRTISWHRHRFQQRIQSEFSGRWGEFDVVYVHSNIHLASYIAQHRPTVLRLPGPVTEEVAPVLKTVHAVCANGDALLRIREFLGDHVNELPIGVDARTFKPGSTSVRGSIGWTRQHKVVGYVGRLHHLKGVDLLANAFREIVQTDVNARLLVVGSGPEERSIRRLLAKELEQKFVHIEPDTDHDQLPQWYRAMDIFVMPSRYENYSNALLEAMASGTPFLASDVGGNRSLAETGGGWLFNSSSASSLRSALERTLSSPKELKARGELSARCVQMHHSWEASAERLETIISRFFRK